MNAELGKRVTHDARIVCIQQTQDLGLALRQRSEQQDAVRDALRSGKPYRAGGTARRLQLE
jgi:hypothetical protein